MTTQATTRKTGKYGRTRSAVLLSLAVGAALAGMVALAGTAREAEAAFTEKIVFSSNRTTGTGVNNPTGDYEIFKMNPDGTGVRQLTSNKVDDNEPVLSPDGQKIAYRSSGIQTSNPEGDRDIYSMNTLDGSGKKNLSNNGSDVTDVTPVFSPGGKKIAYQSWGVQTSNPEGDDEVYSVSVVDGSGKKNLSNNGADVYDYYPVFSPDGKKIAYTSQGEQTSNPEGDQEIYSMNTLDGSGKKNLSNNGAAVDDEYPVFSPGGKMIAYTSRGIQASNPEGDQEIYRMNALDGSGNKNLSNNGTGVGENDPVFSPDGQKLAYISDGIQTSNPQGDYEVYRMNALDGSGKKNLSNNGADLDENYPVFSPDGKKIAYASRGIQTSNPQGDWEIYRMNTVDGTGKKNLSNNGSGVNDYATDWGVQAT